MWTLEASPAMTKALEVLASRGLVTTMHGAVEHTVRARLTEAGREATIPGAYLPPDAALRAAGAEALTDAAERVADEVQELGVPEDYAPRIARWLRGRAARLRK